MITKNIFRQVTHTAHNFVLKTTCIFSLRKPRYLNVLKPLQCSGNGILFTVYTMLIM